jgi:hypothetical protein
MNALKILFRQIYIYIDSLNLLAFTLTERKL